MADLFVFNVSPWELFVRGTLSYLFLFLLLRFFGRRGVGAVGLADILVLVLIADAAQNAMAGPYDTLAEGAVVVGTIVGWNWLFDWLAYRFPAFARFAEPRVLTLVRNGVVIDRNLARNLMTRDELLAQLRTHGVEHLEDVKIARLEAEGDVSVVLKQGPPPAPRRPQGEAHPI